MGQHEIFLMILTFYGIVYCAVKVAEELCKGLGRALKRRRMRKALRGRK